MIEVQREMLVNESEKVNASQNHVAGMARMSEYSRFARLDTAEPSAFIVPSAAVPAGGCKAILHRNNTLNPGKSIADWRRVEGHDSRANRVSLPMHGLLPNMV